MKIRSYSGNDIRKLLDKAPYDWRATGTYGVERVLKNGQVSHIPIIYVLSKDLPKWAQYLKSNSIQPTKILPDLKLVSVDNLPKPAKKDNRVVDISYLIKDLEKVAPRYKETHPEIIKYLQDVA